MEREKYAETSSKAIENILKLNKKSWKLYVPLHKKQQLQEQSACCIGIQVKVVRKSTRVFTLKKSFSRL